MHAKRDAVSRPGKAMVKPGSGGLMILEHKLELSQNKDMQKPGTAIIPVPLAVVTRLWDWLYLLGAVRFSRPGWGSMRAQGANRFCYRRYTIMYTILTGRLEKGTQEQQAVFIQLFGTENVQYKFDFYFHWYNIAHEYGHCLCDCYESDIIGLKQEFLVNRFAVSLWRYAGYVRELQHLQEMLNEILQGAKNPVPTGMSIEEYYEQIWRTDLFMDVAVYGYLQFKSVLMALECSPELADVLREMRNGNT